MKKVLILAYDFPPYNTVGAQRPYGWYKYFKSFGFYPVVITRCWDENIKTPTDALKSSKEQNIITEETDAGTIIKTPYKANLRDKIILKYGYKRFVFLRRLLTFFYSFLQYICFYVDNKSSIYKSAKKYLNENSCDYIIATGEPFILFRYASKLSKKFKIPWIADYRDGWTTNYSILHNISKIDFFLLKNFFQKLEKRFVKSASFITTTSDVIKEDLSELHLQKNIHIIFNGFFKELYDEPDIVGLKQNTEFLEIAYAGTLYPFQPLEIFLEGFYQFVKKHKQPPVKIIFYGVDYYFNQSKRILSYNSEIKRYIEIIQRIPHKELLIKLKRANVLLLLTCKEGTAKIFDYLPLNRKILLVIKGHGYLEKVLKETNGGIICKNSDNVLNSLSILYEEFLKNREIPHQTINYEIYSRENQTKILAELLTK